MIENVCEIVLLNMAGHAALGKPFSEVGFRADEYEALEGRFRAGSVKEIENILNAVLETMVEQAYEGSQELLNYFKYAVKNMAVRIDTAVQTKQLDKIFLL